MSTASDPFRHLAVFFHDVDGLVATLAPMLTEALARGDLVWAAVDDPARGALERRLGSAADDVVFGEPAQPYSYSGQTTASRRADRLRELTADGRAALVLSDSSTVGGPGPRSSAPDFWSVVDASCNLALTGLPVTLVCLCVRGERFTFADLREVLRQGQRGEVRRPAGRHRRRAPSASASPPSSPSPTCRSARSSTSPLIDPDARRGQPADPRHARPRGAFARSRSLTVGEFREYLLDDATRRGRAARDCSRAITPEVAAAVAKLMSNKDLVLAASKIRNVTRCRNTHGRARRARHPRAAEPPGRRPRRHPAVGRRRAAVRLRRRGHRRQPGDRVGRDGRRDPARPRPADRRLRRPDAGLLPGPHHHAARLPGARRAGRPAVPVGRRHRRRPTPASASTWRCCARAASGCWSTTGRATWPGSATT